MCGRYALSADRDALALEFDVDAVSDTKLPARWNIAPTSDIYIVRERVEEEHATRELVVARWGLIPSWAQDAAMGARLVNARSETVAEKPAFRRAFARRRCIIPAQGWYEWQSVETAGGRPLKQPFFHSLPQGRLSAFAGIYEWWRDPAADPAEPQLLTAALLTAEAVGPAAQVHSRMPVLLPTQLWEHWLDPQATADAPGVLAAAVAGLAAVPLEVHAVSRAVNSARNEGAHLIEPDATRSDTLF